MASLYYDDIYSRFHTKVKAYEFTQMADNIVEDFMCNWLHGVVADPFARRLFSSCTMDDSTGEITYTMKYPIDDFSDKEFLIDLFALGMVIRWLEPKVQTTTNMVQTYGTSEMKFYSEANHLTSIADNQHNCIAEFRRKIADRGYVWNSYLESNS